MTRRVALAVELVLAACGSAVSDELVTNGGFETGNLTGWTLSGNAEFMGTSNGYRHSGSWGVYAGPYPSKGLGFLSQSIATTPGETYDVSFWLFSHGGIPNEFAAFWGSDPLVDLVNGGALEWTRYEYHPVATGTLTDLRFGFRHANYFGFDDASVTGIAAMPVPGDANDDRIVDDLDASIVAAHWQSGGVGPSQGDFDGDGMVNDRDAAILAAHWSHPTEQSGPPSDVPEPSVLVTLLIGVSMLLARRRR
ncbi:MAG: dockerin type I domain-containing protein [Planctomycetia bacterium]|nr:dockerin type I domain-containing protein [Planctomycetia bacterium]